MSPLVQVNLPRLSDVSSAFKQARSIANLDSRFRSLDHASAPFARRSNALRVI
jgi:hypothetical protein